MFITCIDNRRTVSAMARRVIATALTLAISATAAPPAGIDFEMGGSGAAPGAYADLRDMAFDSADCLYTLEGPKETKDRDAAYAGNARIQKYGNDGKFLSQFPIRDNELGKNDDPRRLAIDARGHVFVTYPSAGWVREFGPDGARIRDVAVPAANAIIAYKNTVAVIGGLNLVVNGRHAHVGGDQITLLDGGHSQTVRLATTLINVADLASDSHGNFYVLAATNAVYQFAPDGALLKILGAQTNTRVVDGSELKHSLAVDSAGNLYSMAGSFLTRFAADWQTVAQREVRYRWFEPSDWKLLALDSNDRIWAATPDLVTHPLFERFHLRPVIMRAEQSFLYPQEKGVRTFSGLGLGLKAQIVPGPEFGVAYDLKEFPSELVIAPANRNVQKLRVTYRVFDAFRRQAGGGTFEMALENGQACRASLPFTPPRFGWYLLDVSLAANEHELFRIGQQVAVTPDFAGMPRLEKVDGLGGTDDAPKQMFAGLPNMRLNAGADPKSLDRLETTLAAATKYGAVPFVAFTDEKDVTEASVRAAVTQFKGRVKVWEIINEPNLRMKPERYVEEFLKPAARIIHEVDPEAKVMGPAGCGVNLSWYEGFYQAGGRPLVDILSIHDYEGHETVDPVHWRWKIGELRAIMARHGDADKPIWQTERVFSGVRGGDFMPLYQAVNLAQHRDLLETLGITPDHNNHYYLNSMGYATVPSYLWSANGPHPAALVLRTRYAQTLGRTYDGALDFGPDGNRIFSALRYRGVDGQTLVLRNEGLTDQPLSLTVTSGKTLRVVDAWGNVSDLPVRRGQVALTVAQLPQYVKLTPDQDVTPSRLDFGRNLAERATFTYSAPAKHSMSLLNNGIIEVIHAGHPAGGTDGHNIWTGELPEIDGRIIPQTLDMAFDTPRTVERIVLQGLRADNQFCTLLDYDIQAEIDGSWKTLVEARTSVPPSDTIALPPTTVVQWNGNEHLMVHRFDTPVTTARLRLIARRATYGFQFDRLAADATQKVWGGHGKMTLMLREVELYAPQEPLAVVIRVAEPQKTALFETEEATVTVTNKARRKFVGTATVRAPAGWMAEPMTVALQLAPRAAQTFALRLTPPAQLPIGAAFVDITVADADGKRASDGWLRYDIIAPVELVPGNAKDVGTPRQTLTAVVKNVTPSALAGVVRVDVDGQSAEQTFGPLEGDQSVTVSLPVPELKLVDHVLTAHYRVLANSLEMRAEQSLGVRQWNVIGTWPQDLETAFGPEKDAGHVDLAQQFTDGMGQEQKWQVVASEPSGYLNMLFLQPHENITAYALIYVESPTTRRAIFSAGTDDGGKAWLNGELVFTDTAKHDSVPGQVQKPVTLRAGKNEVLFKIVQGKFNMGLHFDVLDEDGKPMRDVSLSSSRSR